MPSNRCRHASVLPMARSCHLHLGNKNRQLRKFRRPSFTYRVGDERCDARAKEERPEHKRCWNCGTMLELWQTERWTNCWPARHTSEEPLDN